MSHIQWLDAEEPSKKRAKLVWECRSINGKRKRMSHVFKPGTPQKEIRRYQRKVEQEYEDTFEVTDFNCKRFAEFIDFYFAEYAIFLSPSTISKYRNVCYNPKNGLVVNLGNISLDKLSVVDCQKYVNLLIEQDLSPKSISTIIGVGRTIFEKALRLNFVRREYNVFSRVVKPKQIKKPVDAYTKEEVVQLLQIVECQDNFFLKLQVMLAIGTGCRRSELAAITIEDIDFNKHTLSVNKARVQASGGTVQKATKTASGTRIIPISYSVEKLLQQAIKQYNLNKLRYGQKFEDSRCIFSNENGKAQGVNSITSRWNRFMTEQNSIRYVRFHDLRHTYASLAVQSCANIKDVSVVMGHSEISTTLNTYTRAYGDSIEQYAKSLDETIFSKNVHVG